MNNRRSISTAQTDDLDNRQSIGSYHSLIINPKTINISKPPKKRPSMMKKLNIFNPSGKKKSDRSSQGPDCPQSPSGDTLNRIVNLKEEQKRRWELEQEEFQRRKREHQLQLIDIERKEVQRREEEVRRRNEGLDEVKRKNKLVQDAVKDQIKMLTEKLEEYKSSHQKEEESLESEIEEMEDQLMAVKGELERRVEALQDDIQDKESLATVPSDDSMPSPSAPAEFSMYPPIPPDSRAYESSKILLLNTSSNPPQPMPRQPHGTSVGSSPLSSVHSASSRSATPKTEVSELANDNGPEDYSV